jgi:heavy metal sensor kinase
MRSRLQRLSVGARWTLLYTVVVAIVMAVPAAYVWLSVGRLARREATLLLDVYVSELRSGLELDATSAGGIAQRLSSGSGAARALDVGVAVFDADGALEVTAGSLAQASRSALPADLASGRGSGVAEVDLGRPFPYVLATAPGPAGSRLQVALSLEPFWRRIRRVRRLVELSVPIALLLAAAAGWWLAHRSLRPVAQMTRIAREITASKLAERIPTSGSGDELDELARTLNEMVDRISNGIEQLRRFSSHAAHQLRSPISRLRSRIEVLLATEKLDEATREILGDLLDEAVVLSNTIEGMLRLARSEAGLVPGQAQPVDVVELLESVVALFEPVAREKGLVLRSDVTTRACIEGDLAWLRQLFANLLENAVKFTPSGRSVEVATRLREGGVEVRIADTGRGIPEPELGRVFERFYRAGMHAGTAGVGLGLPLAAEIARAHGGWIRVESEQNVGSCFRVWLPLRSDDDRRPPPRRRAYAS